MSRTQMHSPVPDRGTEGKAVRNLDPGTVEGFGDEWLRFTQSGLDEAQKQRIFDEYFGIFPWHLLPRDGGVGADIGCGSGRWADIMAARAGHLHLIDASEAALHVAQENLSGRKNVSFHHASVDDMPFPDGSLDFAYSLGVLHHVPDTGQAIRSIARKLRPGAPFLVYLYYAFDNRPGWFRLLWRMSDIVRQGISRMPKPARYLLSQVIAGLIYWPLARLGLVLDRLSLLPSAWPLAYYREKSFYVMRNDSLDRFGTRLEKRFTRGQIKAMIEASGFVDIRFSETPPFWCAVGIKSADAHITG